MKVPPHQILLDEILIKSNEIFELILNPSIQESGQKQEWEIVEISIRRKLKAAATSCLPMHVYGIWVVGTIAGAPGGFFGSKSRGSQEWIKQYGIFYPSNLNKTQN